jgi:formylglycine-generating enzyme required for sulfatase activity
MNNGQGEGDTETGTYTLMYGVPEPSNGRILTRTAGATIALTNEDEWYKAAYYDPAGKRYFKFPTGPSVSICNPLTRSLPNAANCVGNLSQPIALAPVGSYRHSRSPYGTFDQGGNVFEWNEAIVIIRCRPSTSCDPSYSRGRRGGSFQETLGNLYSGQRGHEYPFYEFTTMGFRLVMLPTPTPASHEAPD